jgi:adenylate cyclase
VFPSLGDPGDACRRAVAAAAAGLRAFESVPSAKEHDLHAGVAVNLGDVMYGNVGAADRLDFTVIGPAVNETARMEAMCKPLQTSLVLAESVAKHLPPADVVALGSHALRGVTGERALFSLRR